MWVKVVKEIHDATQTAKNIFSSAYLYKYERSQGLETYIYTIYCFFSQSCYLLVIAPSNINGYRFTHCVYQLQLIASMLLNRWFPHFTNFLGVCVNSVCPHTVTHQTDNADKVSLHLPIMISNMSFRPIHT